MKKIMNNGRLIMLVNLIQNGGIISDKDIKDLNDLKEQYKEEMTRLCCKGDVSQSLFFREQVLILKELIDKADENIKKEDNLMDKTIDSVKIGDRIIGYDQYNHDYVEHQILVTSIDNEKESVTDSNPTGKVLFGDDLTFDKDEIDNYIERVDEGSFVRILDMQPLTDMIKAAIDATDVIQIIDDSAKINDGCTGVRVRIGDYSFYCFGDIETNPDTVEDLHTILDEMEIADKPYTDFYAEQIAKAIWDYEGHGLEKDEALYYEALINETYHELMQNQENNEFEFE